MPNCRDQGAAILPVSTTSAACDLPYRNSDHRLLPYKCDQPPAACGRRARNSATPLRLRRKPFAAHQSCLAAFCVGLADATTDATAAPPARLRAGPPFPLLLKYRLGPQQFRHEALGTLALTFESRLVTGGGPFLLGLDAFLRGGDRERTSW